MKPSTNPKAVAAGALIAGLSLAILAGIWQARDNAAVAQKRFAAVIAKVVEQVGDRLQPYEYGLRGARGAVVVAGTDKLDRRLYRRYSETREIEREFPGAGGFGVIRRVAPADEAAFVAKARGEDRPDFSIRQFVPHAGERYVIQYIEPAESNAIELGVDIASEPSRRGAAEQAMRSGKAVLTPPIALGDTHEHRDGKPPQRSFLLLLPIYDEPARSLATAQAREAATVGWTFARLTIDDVLKGFNFDGGAFTLALRDGSDAAAIDFFASPGSQAPAAGGLARRIAIPIYGRVWEADVRAQPRFFELLNQRDPKTVAGVGILIAALLSSALYARGCDAQRARQLRHEMALRAAIVDSASDAIVGETLDGIVIDWNRAAQRLFGYSAQEAVGRSIASLLLPVGSEPEDAELRTRIAQGQEVPPFDAVRRAADGTLIDVSVAVSPVYAADGHIFGVAKTLRDMRPTRAAERRMLEHSGMLEQQVGERTAALEASRRELQTILDALPSMISYWDKDLLNRFANQAYRNWHATDPEAIKGMHKRELLGDAMFERCRPHVEAALLGEPQSFELALEVPMGSGAPVLKHVLAHYMPDKVGDEVRGFYVLVHDITEQIHDKARLAAALRENEALLSTIHMHAIVSVADRRGRIIDVNDAFCRISGYSRDELLGQNHRIVKSGTHDAVFWSSMWITIAHGEPWRGVVCNRAKDGSLYWVDSMVSPLVGQDGQIEKYISIRFDITATKLAEQRLRESERFLDRVGAVAGVGGWEHDLRTDEVKWSTQTRRIHEVESGYQPRHEQSLDFYPPQARREMARAVAEGLASGQGFDVEMPLVTAKGRSIWIRSVAEVEMEGGRPVRLVGAFQDITSRKRTQLQLQQTNDRFALASIAARIGVWEWDIAAGTIVWDEQMYRLYGRSAGDGVEPYALWADNLHPLDRERVESEVQRGASGEQEFDTEFRILWPDGEVRHLKAAARLHRDDSGCVRRLTGVNFDITERKRAEMALLETSSLLQSVLDAASEFAIIATRPDHKIAVFNRGAELLLGYTADELIGVATPVLMHDPAEIKARALELSIELGRPVSAATFFTEPSTLRSAHPWTYLAKDGRRISVSLVVTAICDSAGDVLGYLGVAHDVTLQQQLETSLRHARHKAEQANLAKSRFLAYMSHELRTPMNAVLGLAYLLGRTPLNAEQASFLGQLERAGNSLLSMINDSLDISKIEAGELRVTNEAFCPADLLGRLADMARVQSDAAAIEFELDLPARLPAWLEGDALRLHQVLTNLTSNAIKFTERGGVRLVVRELQDDSTSAPDRVWLRFEVHDTGIGISSEDAGYLFQPFSQADPSITRRFGGTGLGLSIAKQLTGLMGGRIGLQSTPGLGSVFWVELGFARCEAPAVALPTAMLHRDGHEGLKGVRVLVVDDSRINLEVACRILRLEGAGVAVAANGQEAVESLRREPAEFDLVLMDVQMPVQDGIEATRRIRGELQLIDLPVIGLTAGALNSQREEAVRAGMNDFMFKPFEPREVVDCIRRHIAQARGRALPPALAAPIDTSIVTAWQEIDGIATEEVAGRLYGDKALFRSLLSHLLDEFSPSGDAVEPVSLRELGAKMHKLAGCAGNVGARSIRALAMDAEAACVKGNAALAHGLAQRLDDELVALRRSAAGWLDDADALTTLPIELDARPTSPAALARLMDLLRRQQTAAIEQFAAVSADVRRQVGDERWGLVHGHIENLRFSEAVQVLADGGIG